MSLRANFPRKLNRFVRSARGAAASLALAALSLAAACGDPALPSAPTPKPFNEGEVQARIDNLQSQVSQLEGLADTLRRDLESIDATRLSLTAQIENLRQDLLGGKPAVAAAAAPATAAVASKPAPVAAAATTPSPAAAKPSGFFRKTLTLAFVVIIIGAVIYIGNIFLGRWGAEEEVPMVERETDLGTVRFPAAAQEAAEEKKPEKKTASAKDEGAIVFRPSAPIDDDDETGDYPPVKPSLPDED